MKITNKIGLIFYGMVFSLISASTATAATAYWTGKSEMVQTVTHRMAWRCEYNYNGRVFTELFESSCPSSVTVETPSGYDYQSGSSGYSSYSAKAIWTGESQMVQDANYQMVWQCVYNYNGQRIVRLFKSSCPSSIDVR